VEEWKREETGSRPEGQSGGRVKESQQLGGSMQGEENSLFEKAEKNKLGGRNEHNKGSHRGGNRGEGSYQEVRSGIG